MKAGLKTIIALLALGSSTAFASNWHQDSYLEVKVTNLTRGQSFTPLISAAHKHKLNLVTLGEAASDEIAAIAEGGNTAPLADKLAAEPGVGAIVNGSGLVLPGESVTLEIPVDKRDRRISLATMLIPTNDAFIVLDGKFVPYGRTVTYYAKAYDAGSEPNDELCVSIPGPVCGGAGGSPEEDGEGYVHPHAGIHGIGDLAPTERDWNNPVAKIEVTRKYR